MNNGLSSDSNRDKQYLWSAPNKTTSTIKRAYLNLNCIVHTAQRNQLISAQYIIVKIGINFSGEFSLIEIKAGTETRCVMTISIFLAKSVPSLTK